MSFRARLVETADTMLAKGTAKVDDIVAKAVAAYGTEFADEGTELAWRAARRQVTEYLRSLDGDDDGQDSIPGIAGMPRAICVGDYYVSTQRATWAELQAGRGRRQDNIGRARERLQKYDAFLDRVRAHMEADPAATVADALAAETAKADAA